MPNLGTLKIHPTDLFNILEKLKQVQWSLGAVTLVDDGSRFVIRDSGDHLVGYVEKVIEVEHSNG